MALLRAGKYLIFPVDAAPGEGLSIVTPGESPANPVLPVRVNRIISLWNIEDAPGPDGKFNVSTGAKIIKPVSEYSLFRKDELDNALFVQNLRVLPGPAQDFRIEAVDPNPNIWVIRYPNEDSVLTYDPKDEFPLKFRPSIGVSAQRFVLKRIEPEAK